MSQDASNASNSETGWEEGVDLNGRERKNLLHKCKLKITQIADRVRVTEEQNARLLNRLKSAVRNAAANGDALASMVKASSLEQIVANLVAHFEAAGKPDA